MDSFSFIRRLLLPSLTHCDVNQDFFLLIAWFVVYHCLSFINSVITSVAARGVFLNFSHAKYCVQISQVEYSVMPQIYLSSLFFLLLFSVNGCVKHAPLFPVPWACIAPLQPCAVLSLSCPSACRQLSHCSAFSSVITQSVKPNFPFPSPICMFIFAWKLPSKSLLS